MSNPKHYLHVRYCGDVEHNCHLFMVIDDIMLHSFIFVFIKHKCLENLKV